MSSLWQHRFYYLFGFLFIVLVVGFFNTFRFIFSCLYLVGRVRRGALKCICFSRKEKPFKYEDLVDRFENSSTRKLQAAGGGASGAHTHMDSLHQPLVIAMAAGFVVVNFTSSRRSFLRILHDSSEPVYICFFTLTGMTLQLDALPAVIELCFRPPAAPNG